MLREGQKRRTKKKGRTSPDRETSPPLKANPPPSALALDLRSCLPCADPISRLRHEIGKNWKNIGCGLPQRKREKIVEK